MRLILCFTVDLALHGVFFGFRKSKFAAPALHVSLEPRSVDLRIRTRVPKQAVPLPPQEEPKPEVQPQKKIEKKVVPKKPAPRKEPPRPPKKEQPPEKPEPFAKQSSPVSYTSEVPTKPRLVERHSA